ncbi:MAG TPA: Fe(2+)-trafficking protein [Candidatus Polarisedimenticolaceae bacterium]|nr:Fe(2+)-trafficking protein [Candidatus Polarisedimenticolaceae bacterium]
MGVVTCIRCKKEGPGLDRAPFPGPVGARIAAGVCAACWKEWLGMQVKYINEYRLNPLDPRHFEFLLEQAQAFLGLPGAGPAVPDPGTPR